MNFLFPARITNNKKNVFNTIQDKKNWKKYVKIILWQIMSLYFYYLGRSTRAHLEIYTLRLYVHILHSSFFF